LNPEAEQSRGGFLSAACSQFDPKQRFANESLEFAGLSKTCHNKLPLRVLTALGPDKCSDLNMRITHQTEDDIGRLGPVARVFAAWVFLSSLLTGYGVGQAIFREPFDPQMIVGVGFFGYVIHVSGSVTFRGYAPKYLQFSRGPK
jgi:hypothetical protein